MRYLRQRKDEKKNTCLKKKAKKKDTKQEKEENKKRNSNKGKIEDYTRKIIAPTILPQLRRRIRASTDQYKGIKKRKEKKYIFEEKRKR